MDKKSQSAELEHAREVFLKGLDLMRLDADVEQIVLADMERLFRDDEEAWAFAA